MWKRLLDIDVVCAEFMREMDEGRLVIVHYRNRKLHALPRTGPNRARLEADHDDPPVGVAVFVGDRPQVGEFYVGEPVGGNEAETKNIFEPGKPAPETAAKPGKGGRKPEHRWGEIRQEIVRRIFVNGRLKEPNNVSKLAAEIARWYEAKYQKMPDDSALRRTITETVATLKALFT